jgi:hypothetical protein
VLHRRYHARWGVDEDLVSGRRCGGDVQAVEDEVRSLGEQQRILAAERFAPGAIPDHRRFTPSHLRDLAAGWEAGAAAPGQSRLVKRRHQGLAVPVKILGCRVTVLTAADSQGDSQRSSSTGGDQHSN